LFEPLIVASFAAPGFSKQHREVPQNAGPSARLHFLLVRFLYAGKENEQVKRAKET